MYAYFAGKKANKTFEPSSGGNGIRLNTTNTMFKITILEVTVNTPAVSVPVVASRRISKPKTTASSKLEITPANATQIIPFLTL